VFGWILNWAKDDDLIWHLLALLNVHKQMGGIDSLQRMCASMSK
jgi:hypothetical protein